MQSNPAIVHFFNPLVLLAAGAPPVTTAFTIILLVLMMFSFITSGAEVAFFTLTGKDINLLKTKEQPSYKKIVDLLEEPKLLLASLLIGHNIFNIAIIILSSLIIDDVVHFTTSMWVIIFIKVIIITCVLLLFCEIIPRVLASTNNVRFAEYTGLPVEMIYFSFKRAGGWLVKYTDVIEKRLDNNARGQYGSNELENVIGTEENEDEKNILLGIAKFGNITVRQIMRSRLDVSGVDEKTPFNELIRKIEELHYSRLPVYKDDLDEVVGIINTKDVLPYINNPADFNWRSLMRLPYFVHEQKLIKDLLREFQTKHIHFAIVVDEFGGTSGIVTLEDVMEEIIGDIKDEFDEEESGFKKIDDDNYIFDGKSSLNDVCKMMELPIDIFDNVRGNSESLAGLVLELAARIPQINTPVPSGDFEFTVLEIAKNRLQKIKVSIKPREEK